MLKITVENITKVSEDLLVRVLNTLPESHPMYDLIDAELERRGDQYVKAQAAKQAAEIKRLQELHHIENKISDLLESMKSGRKMAVLISLLGDEFMDDYSVCEVTFTVTSHVAKFSKFDVPGFWTFDSLEEANAKKAERIYGRIYDKYMRNASIESLEYLESVLFGR